MGSLTLNRDEMDQALQGARDALRRVTEQRAQKGLRGPVVHTGRPPLCGLRPTSATEGWHERLMAKLSGSPSLSDH